MRSLAKSARVLALLVPLVSAVGLTEQASTAEPDESGAAEGSQTPSQPISTDTLCSALAAAAAQNDLPTDFFARLIWQESRFDPLAVSRAGAQGVAQFMPATASRRGLSNPFDPLEAIAESARLLRDLRREFGNLGLAAAAYNAGSGRVHDWLAGWGALPECASSPATHRGNGPARGQASARCSRKCRSHAGNLPRWRPARPRPQAGRHLLGA